ncbi:UNVERIFIED_CONTAM: hypothetical protein GTU68_035734 [Idotea baltica]|nr:hypothetical protein [Idotea baltica]
MKYTEQIRSILRAEAKAIENIPVDESYEKAIAILLACEGKVLTTGIGKAGHIARKCAATLCSTATPADFVHPAEAAHGDLGLVGPGDVVIAFSTSGKSREVIEMLELSRDLGVDKAIGITSHPDSPLRGLCEVILGMGDIEEPCPLSLTPSASTAVMHAIGDALALTLMQEKGTTREDFGRRHHGGYLGRKARSQS